VTGEPLIGLTTYPVDEGGRVSLPADYLDSVRRAGGRPVLLAPGDADPAGVLAHLDGLLLAGGGDLDPALWHAAAHETVYGRDHDRDAADLALAGGALERGLPTLAICRGMQVVNVALGGTLHQHLPDVVGDTVQHRLPPREPVPHPIEADPGSLVAKVMGTTVAEPVSWHHQAVDRLGGGLRVTARADDGVVEAVEHDEHPWLLAVQWHPEMSAATDPTQQAIFDSFVREAAG
jgi:putative glutamine amidotransferase